MYYMLKYALLASSMSLLVKAYHREHTYPVPSHSLKSQPPPGGQNRERTQSRDFNGETNDKLQYASNADMHQSPGRRPQSGPTGSDNHNQYPEENNRGNHPKSFHERNRGPHSTPELRELSDDSSGEIKYSHNKAGGNNDKSYQDNYPERHSQSAYNDKSSRPKYSMQLESREPQNKQHSHNAFVERSREADDSRNIRYESRQTNEPVNEYPRYPGSEEEVNRRPTQYSQHSAEYPAEKPEDEQRYLKSSNQNYQTHSPSLGIASSHPGQSKQHYQHPRQQYDLESEQNSRRPLSKESSHYPHIPKDNAPTHSNYRESIPSSLSSESEEAELYPNHNRDNVPNHSGHRQSNLPAQSSTEGNRQRYQNQRDGETHEQHDSVYKSSRQQPSPYQSPDVYQPPNTYQQPNTHQLPNAYQEPNTHQQPNAYKQPNTYQQPNAYKDHNTYQQPNAYQQPNTYQKPPVNEQESINQEKSPVQQQGNRNAMKVVETKKDMQPLPSEADTFSEEHNGFLDMGAYTDKQGSFGWYADFPVGKEHDKVTYSFSK